MGTPFHSLCSFGPIMDDMINKLTERDSRSSSPQITTGSSFFIKDILFRYEFIEMINNLYFKQNFLKLNYLVISLQIIIKNQNIF